MSTPMVTSSRRAMCRDGTRRRAAERPAVLLAVAFAALAAGCGGNSDGSVGVGSGQDPDPVVLDFPIAYTRRPLRDSDGALPVSWDLRELLRFIVGSDLYVRDRASPSSPERNVTIAVTEGRGDVQGIEMSADGTKVLFAMRGPFDPNLARSEERRVGKE